MGVGVRFHRSSDSCFMDREFRKPATESPRYRYQAVGLRWNDPAMRELAAWYRQYAKRPGNLNIWDARLRTADDLEATADRI
jgi:hypothetical protein